MQIYTSQCNIFKHFHGLNLIDNITLQLHWCNHNSVTGTILVTGVCCGV